MKAVRMPEEGNGPACGVRASTPGIRITQRKFKVFFVCTPYQSGPDSFCGLSFFSNHTALFIKRSPIACHSRIILFQICGICPLIDLPDCLHTAIVQCIQCFRILYLKHRSAVFFIILYHDITAAFPIFFIRIHFISGTGKNTRKKCMVKIFPVVMVTDGPAQKLCQFKCNVLRIPAPNSGE